MLLERASGAAAGGGGAAPGLKYRRGGEAGRVPGSELAHRPLREPGAALRPSAQGAGRCGEMPGALQPQPRNRADPPDPDMLPMREERASFLVLLAVSSPTGPPGRRIKPGPDPPEVFHQKATVLSPTSVLLWLCGNC